MDVDYRLEHLTDYNRHAVQLIILSFRQYENLASELGELAGCSVAGSVAKPVD